jgi:plasmid maintenance system antidote protein VapI
MLRERRVKFSKAKTPENLFNAMLTILHWDNTAGIADRLGMSHPALTRVRSGENDVSPNLILRTWAITGWPIEFILNLAGITVIENPITVRKLKSGKFERYGS